MIETIITLTLIAIWFWAGFWAGSLAELSGTIPKKTRWFTPLLATWKASRKEPGT